MYLTSQNKIIERHPIKPRDIFTVCKKKTLILYRSFQVSEFRKKMNLFQNSKRIFLAQLRKYNQGLVSEVPRTLDGYDLGSFEASKILTFNQIKNFANRLKYRIPMLGFVFQNFWIPVATGQKFYEQRRLEWKP